VKKQTVVLFYAALLFAFVFWQNNELIAACSEGSCDQGANLRIQAHDNDTNLENGIGSSISLDDNIVGGVSEGDVVLVTYQYDKTADKEGAASYIGTLHQAQATGLGQNDWVKISFRETIENQSNEETEYTKAEVGHVINVNFEGMKPIGSEQSEIDASLQIHSNVATWSGFKVEERGMWSFSGGMTESLINSSGGNAEAEIVEEINVGCNSRVGNSHVGADVNYGNTTTISGDQLSNYKGTAVDTSTSAYGDSYNKQLKAFVQIRKL
jgi:hypothetical protein